MTARVINIIGLLGAIILVICTGLLFDFMVERPRPANLPSEDAPLFIWVRWCNAYGQPGQEGPGPLISPPQERICRDVRLMDECERGVHDSYPCVCPDRPAECLTNEPPPEGSPTRLLTPEEWEERNAP